MNKALLAIIIPTYKARFLQSTLSSIALQTCNNFHLYVGDDASPEDIYTVVKSFEKKVPLTYHRFEDNLGGISLTRQWERCIALSRNEPYIWLFPDDDVMPEDAVERFYSYLKIQPDADVFRFPLKLINSKGQTVGNNRIFPKFEVGSDFLLRRLHASVHSAITEFIFSREIYHRYMGFVEFPLAWCSDTATIALYTKYKPMVSIPGNAVCWRTTDSTNISSSTNMNNAKFEAHMQFIRWIGQNFSEYKLTKFKKAILFYLEFVFAYVLNNLPPKGAKRLTRSYLTDEYGYFKGNFLFLKLNARLSLYYPYRSIRRKMVSAYLNLANKL